MMESITDVENQGSIWIWIGIAAILINLVFVGTSRWEFAYGVIYAFGFLTLGLALSMEDKGMIASASAAIIALLAFILQVTSISIETVKIYAVVSGFLFAAALYVAFLKQDITEDYADYTLTAALALWVLYALAYFANRLMRGWALPLETVLFHGGILLLASMDLLDVGLDVDMKSYNVARLAFGAIAIIGMLLVTATLGWGLTLLP